MLWESCQLCPPHFPLLWQFPGFKSYVCACWGSQGWLRWTGKVLWPRPPSGSFLPVVTFTFVKFNDCSGKWTPDGVFSRNTDSSGCTNLQLGNLQPLAATTVLPTAVICTYASLMFKLLILYSNVLVHPGACKALILFLSAIHFIYPSEHL